MSTKDLIDAIVIGDAIAIENAFEATMAEKISARLDDMRVEVAQSMFKVQESVELEEEQLDELSVFKLDAYRKKAREYSDAVPSSGKPGPLSKERKKAIRRDVGAEMADDKIKAKTGTYHPGLIAKVKDKYFSKTNEEVELEEAADMAKLRQQLDKHSEAAIKANREGNDEAVKKHQIQMNKIKDKMAKLARNEEVELDEEQLDELSKGTLGSYIKKAGQHRVRLAGKERDLEDKVDQISKAKHGSDDDTYKALSQAQKNVDDQRWKVRDKSDKRAEGIGRAVKRLTKEEAEEILASEEFEQLDELSKGTLGSYIKKAGQHRVRLAGKERDLEDKVDQISKAKHGSDDDTYKALSQAQKNVDDQRWKVRDKSDKRAEGIGRAVKRLTKEEAEEILASEEFEQLDELSKTTLASYVKRASRDAESKGFNAGGADERGNDKSAGIYRQAGEKRLKNVAKAVDKLTKEELTLEDFSSEELEEFMMSEDFEQLDELSKEKLGWYLKKASKHMDKKGENMIKRDKKFKPGMNPVSRAIGGTSQRLQSIALASKKYLAKEETELDEAVKVSDSSKRNYEYANGQKPKGAGRWMFSTIEPRKHDVRNDEHMKQTFTSSHTTFANASKEAAKHFKAQGHNDEIHVLS